MNTKHPLLLSHPKATECIRFLRADKLSYLPRPWPRPPAPCCAGSRRKPRLRPPPTAKSPQKLQNSLPPAISCETPKLDGTLVCDKIWTTTGVTGQASKDVLANLLQFS